MTILSSLKKLHKKMTGQETTSKTIGGILDSIQENYSGGGASGGSADLPTITSENNGQILGVVNGTWNTVPQPISSFVIHIGAYDNVMFTQESAQDIIDAYTNSIPIEAYMESTAFADYQGTTIKYQIEKIYYSNEQNDDKPYKIVFSYYDENEVTKRKYITMESASLENNYGITLT